MAKMRATLRKATQVTPPPSPKNGDDIKANSDWSSRLRNHSKGCEVVAVKKPERRSIKKEPALHNGTSNTNKSRSPSPVCPAVRRLSRTRNGEVSPNYWGPRRSARLIGIPAEEEKSPAPSLPAPATPPIANGTGAKANGDEVSNDVSESCLPLKKRRIVAPPPPPEEPEELKKADGLNGVQVVNGQCVNGRDWKKKKYRMIDALLLESERFMQYPSRNSCRMRSTFNSRDVPPRPCSPEPSVASPVAPPTEEEEEKEPPPPLLPAPPTPPPPLPTPPPVNPDSVDQVVFSFEIVPSGATWFQTFLRDEVQQQSHPPPPPECLAHNHPAPFLLPYEMSLEAILKSNRTPRKKRTPGAPKKNHQPAFRPIISTRLQMQSAARQSAKAAADEMMRTASDRRKRKAGSNMPRKSPRCHASTMAILCSKTDPSAPSTNPLLPVVKEEPPEEEEEEEVEEEEGVCNMRRVLEQILTQGAGTTTTPNPSEPPCKRKRGRPRKYPLPAPVQPQPVISAPLAGILSTPVVRIGDLVDERIVLGEDPVLFDDDDPLRLLGVTDESAAEETTAAATNPPPDVFHDVTDQASCSSVYETASDLGSTSTSSGTCDRRGHHRGHHHRGNKWRRKRPNMTGWPRSKKRKLPAIHFSSDLSDDDEDDDDVSDPSSSAGTLSTIHEESSSKDSLILPSTSTAAAAASGGPGGGSPNGNGRNPGSLQKPFQFQRKSLKFVGKRILRPAAQRHAPQRLEYWPCFSSESKRRRRK